MYRYHIILYIYFLIIVKNLILIVHVFIFYKFILTRYTCIIYFIFLVQQSNINNNFFLKHIYAHLLIFPFFLLVQHHIFFFLILRFHPITTNLFKNYKHTIAVFIFLLNGLISIITFSKSYIFTPFNLSFLHLRKTFRR